MNGFKIDDPAIHLIIIWVSRVGTAGDVNTDGIADFIAVGRLYCMLYYGRTIYRFQGY